MGTSGVGFPDHLYLEEFGSKVWDAFGECGYLVGSTLRTSSPRDVDVRVILAPDTWAKWFPDLPADSDESVWRRSGKWVALCLAFSELGHRMTGLPIDFQIQPQEYANRAYPPPACPRSALGFVPWRWAKIESPAAVPTRAERRPGRPRKNATAEGRA
jgi:hypothetical protein